MVQLSVISYQLSVISYQLSVISYQLPVTSYQEVNKSLPLFTVYCSLRLLLFTVHGLKNFS
ncbi:hypothetical protein SD80_015285 [Scytonema tolypothrichoides VB-61278]|nr:hypothetical protein SD80_015285 [Scytonema tolypothrichoides VB-61278]